MLIERSMGPIALHLAQKYPVVALLGPRQSGKSTLARHLFPSYQYVNLESPQIRDYAESDPESFFQQYSGQVIIDEVQNVPSLFSYIQVIVDKKKKMGDFILTGSSQFQLTESITQSLAGRVSLLKLLPLSIEELSRAQISANPFNLSVQGFYPALYDRGIAPEDYYADYMQTYIERDVRSLINVKDLKVFQTFLKLCAGRTGSLVNLTSLGNDVGVSRETIKSWLNVLEMSYIIYQIPPFFKNINKRLIKSPKIYFYDVGILCYLLGITSIDVLATHPLRGGIFENLIISDLMKSYYNKHRTPDFYFYRDSKGTEVDLVYYRDGRLKGVEIKSAQSFSTSFLDNLKKWAVYMSGEKTESYVVYGGNISFKKDGTQVLGVEDLSVLTEEVASKK
jgi:uncharacterized protein